MGKAEPLTPLEAARIISTVEESSDSASARAAGFTDMLWGLLIPALFLAGAPVKPDFDGNLGPLLGVLNWLGWPALAVGGCALTFLITRNRAISLAPPVRSVWLYVALAGWPALGVVLLIVSLASGGAFPRGLDFARILMSGPLIVGGAYLIGRGLFLRRQPWHGRPWAVAIGCVVLLAAAVVAGTSWWFVQHQDVWKVAVGWTLGAAWFTHGVLLYNRS